MKFKIIIGRNVDDFEKKMNNFLEKSVKIIDIKYDIDNFKAFILYEDIHYKNQIVSIGMVEVKGGN